MLSMFRRWRDARIQVRNDASALIKDHGESAYFIARDLARDAGRVGDRATQRHWSRVAVRIAKNTGYVIGQKAADRY